MTKDATTVLVVARLRPMAPPVEPTAGKKIEILKAVDPLFCSQHLFPVCSVVEPVLVLISSTYSILAAFCFPQICGPGF